MAKLDISALNQLYTESDSCDKALFSEMRSNTLLVSGEHYTKKGSKFWNRVRDNNQLSQEQKIRLTKNHLQRITKTYINNITKFAPGVTVGPKNETELQDQKSAELNQSVWQDLKIRNKLNRKFREAAADFINIGECAMKIFFDKNKGPTVGYEPLMDENGEQSFDPMTMEALPDESKPVKGGDIVFERIFGFNLLRAKQAKDMDDSSYLIYRKMVAVKDLKIMFPEKDDRQKFIQENSEDVYTVFEGSTGNYENTKGQTMLREFYFRPCADYPTGYFVIATSAGILFEGELPFGIFPIVYAKFDEIVTSPRGRSIIKQLRPYQAEINRAASKIAEHQVTLGDDKLLIQSGTKVAHGGQLPGVRAIQYAGAPPTVLSGRSGEQYLAYMQSQIAEMYQISNLEEDKLEKNGQLDPYAMLYKSLRQKKDFCLYTDKFEDFLVEICEVSLKIAKVYYTERHIIPAVSRKEQINISEFKNTTPLDFQIKIEAQTDDVESKMGKQLTLNHILQYVGPTLGKDDIGRIMSAMPYMNEDEAFGDFTIDYDEAKNALLQLDRGQMPKLHPYTNNEFMMKRLGLRMSQADFDFLNPQIQQMYQMYMQQNMQAEKVNLEKIKAAKDEFIPAGGFLVGCDFYVNVPGAEAAGKTRRARVPYQSLEWLIKKLEEQGMALDKLESMQQGVLADMAGQNQRQPQPPMSIPGMGGNNGVGQPQNFRSY